MLVMGLGQAYLRRWLRAVAWVALAAVVAVLFVPDAVVAVLFVPDAALADPGSAAFADGLPLLAVSVLSVVDAYLLARRHNLSLEIEQTDRCGTCYRELDADLSFCAWCADERPSDPDGASSVEERTAE
jgi:hypothetical protein